MNPLLFTAAASYFVRHWRGQLSLATSALLNGIVGYFILLFGSFAVSQLLSPAMMSSSAFIAPVVIAFTAWFLWAAVGIVRCALRIIRSDDKAIWVRLLGVITLIGVAYIAVLMAQDLWRFF
jgi:hypothetical protein